MVKRPGFAWFGLAVLAVSFGWGIVHLFDLRFSSGDVYPPYSSFRADPLGTKALFESMQNLERFSVRRHVQTMAKFPEGHNTTLLVLGLDWAELAAEPDEFRKLQAFMHNGGRLVVTLFPAYYKPHGFSRSGRVTKPGAGGGPGRKDREAIQLSQQWGFELNHIAVAGADEQVHQTISVNRVTTNNLPERVNWHSGLVLENLGPDWRVIYARETNAVMAVQAVGAGSLVLATDSYLVSNESLRQDRHATLLAWLMGGNRQQVFDETHLGVVESPGIATLARRYRLHGFFGGLLLLAALFVWKSSFSLGPRSDTQTGSDLIIGRDTASGFVNLLRRNIPPKDILSLCIEEWKKTAIHDRRVSLEQWEQVQAIAATEQALPASRRNPVRAYQRISEVLAHRARNSGG